MNKTKLLMVLALIALLVYYLNQVETKPKKPKKSLLDSEPWIIPPTIKPKSVITASVSPEPKIPPEPINFPSKPQETDYSWLTDDNLEFILKNWTPLQEALARANQATRKFNLRTDLANIYNCFYKAKTNQDWDLPEFLERLEDNKATYTLFPLRVNGNHWGLFVLEEIVNKPTPPEPGSIWAEPASTVETKVYYTSSGGGELETEKQQLQPFINQIIGQNTPISTIKPQDRKSKGYECGVYLCFYLREIFETGELKLTRTYTETECQEFRKEWKEKIGESWGKRD